MLLVFQCWYKNLDAVYDVCAAPQEIAFPKMVASCCRFLCYFCRISRQNQKAMFDHLSYLLENSSVGLGEFHFRKHCSFINVQIMLKDVQMDELQGIWEGVDMLPPAV